MGQPTAEQLKKMKRDAEEHAKLLTTAASRQKARLARIDQMIAANKRRLMDKNTDKFMAAIEVNLRWYWRILQKQDDLFDTRLWAQMEEAKDLEAFSVLRMKVTTLTKQITKLEWEAMGVSEKIQSSVRALAGYVQKNDKLIAKETKEKAQTYIEKTLKELKDPTGLGSFPHALLRTR